MECNKEEALRAKDMAENKMQLKEFTVARKIVMKAQMLFPELENVAQMLTVCEVHCSAEAKVNGETDWYAILQVDSTADEITIKKQYRKLALLLHPDKNKFEGAEAAFKLVGEAQRTLSDKTKRNLHDIKRRTVIRNVQVKRPNQPPSRPPVARKPAAVPNAATSSQSNGLNQQQPPQPSNAQTFWTICPFCGIRYQYYLSIVNKALRCQHCMKPFVAYDLNAQAAPSGANTNNQWSHAGIPQHGNRGPGAQSAGQNSQFGTATQGFQGNAGVGSTSSKPVPKPAGPGAATADDRAKYEKVIPDGVNKREHVVKPSGGSTRQKSARKLVVESESSAGSESSDSDVNIEDTTHSGAHNAGTADSNVRRSTRVRQNVSYKENGDTTESSPRSFKRLRKSGKTQEGGDTSKTSFEGQPCVGEQSSGPEKTKWSQNGLHEKQNGTDGMEENLHKAKPFVDSSQGAEDINTLTYPDPEFFDFEKSREASLFEPNQMWAIYDDLDGMPRFYCRIKNASHPDFKVMYTWLEYDPTGVAEKEWVDESLPVSCGKFKLGKTLTTREKAIFSHLVSCKPGMKKNSFEVYPRKGEIWALFKGWDIGWSSDADGHKSFEYEVVEVLSEFTEGTGITVANLVKINGFVCLFMRASDGGPRDIPSSEMLRFSHQVPSYRMTGEERENIPPGSFELDATSLPINFAECFPSVTIGTSGINSKVNEKVHEKQRTRESSPNRPNVADKMDIDMKTGTSGTTTSKVNENVHEKQRTRESSPNMPNVTDKMDTDTEFVAPEQKLDDQETRQDDSAKLNENVSSAAAPDDYVYPDTEFYSFPDGRSEGNFESGQIWALYSDITSYPNYYGLVTKVESVGKFAVHLRWLDGCAVKKEEKRWAKDMSYSCGTFEVGKETMTYDSVGPFSHVVRAEPLDKRDFYSINPKIGEVWALYKNWNIRWTRSNVEDCEYDVVEILARGASGIKCEHLAKVSGHRCVFRPVRNSMIDIPVTEYLRFSHQIPAFRLTEEMGGKLRGYWELDPASIPQLLLID